MDRKFHLYIISLNALAAIVLVILYWALGQFGEHFFATWVCAITALILIVAQILLFRDK